MVTLPVAGTLTSRTPFVDDDHALLWPLPRGRKFVLSRELHEDVGEHFVVAAERGTVVHTLPSEEKHPFVAVGRPDKLAFRLTLRLGHSFVRRGGQQRKAINQTKDRTQHDTLFIM
jgi:hypothetical protein